jgi:integrase/recombinase XerD
MTVWKRRRKKALDKKFTVQFSDHKGIRRRLIGFTDKHASEELERQVLRIVALKMASAALDAEAVKFLEVCGAYVRGKLAEWGIIDAGRAEAGKFITDLLANWRVAITPGNSPHYVKTAGRHIEIVAAACGWQFPADITALAFDQWRVEAKKTLAAKTLNNYMKSVKAFCEYLCRNKILPENPLKYLHAFDEKKDRRRIRRDLSDEDAARLIASTAASQKIVSGMPGHVRALLYRLEFLTGIRHNELRQLERRDFDFTEKIPTVTVRAEIGKVSKDRVIPLDSTLAADLREHLSGLTANALAFAGISTKHGAARLRVDLKEAGIPYQDEAGRFFDFHALRHTAATRLQRHGVAPMVAREILGHASLDMTGLYTHGNLSDMAAAVNGLDVKPATAEPGKNTATDARTYMRTNSNENDGKIRNTTEIEPPAAAAVATVAKCLFSSNDSAKIGLPATAPIHTPEKEWGELPGFTSIPTLLTKRPIGVLLVAL